jgi:hypothetical protein
MSTYPALRSFAVVGAFVFVATLAASAAAQPAPPQVVQGTDGSLYILQGPKAWTLFPGQISDDAVAGLNLSGEINGTFPADLFSVPAPASPAPQAQIRVDVNKELNTVTTGYCYGGGTTSTFIVSLANVEREANGRSVWHVGILNHASVPVELRYSAAYILASDGTKYDAAVVDPLNVAVEERKALDVIPQQNNIPAGAYRLFLLTQQLNFAGGSAGACGGRGSAGGGPTWSSTPISLP